jgi:uncharacterized repeat protein (TIGR03833 family)
MTTLMYVTGGGKNKRYFKIKRKKNKTTGNVSGEVSRISCAEYDDPVTNPTIGRVKPIVGDRVTIIIKPYNQYNCKTGIVKDVLTSKPIHTRGHKTRLTTGEIGRVLKIHK